MQQSEHALQMQKFYCEHWHTDATVNSSVYKCEQIYPTSSVLLKVEGLSLGVL